tara:strand:- start:146 stop:571 length:426 start_codon:yes stop_codon:yes gene_type:complete
MKNKSPSHYKKTESLLKDQYTNKADPKDKFLVDRKNYEVFRDLYFCEDGEGFEQLTAKERNRFRRIAKEYGFKIKTKSVMMPWGDYRYYVWKTETLLEKDFPYPDHQKPYWQQCRERIRRLWNIPMRQEYFKDNKGEKNEN